MMELGPESIKEHTGIIELIASKPWYKVVLVGKDYVDAPPSFLHFTSTEEAKNWYQQENIEHAQVLIKGSRSMAMEKVLE